MPDKKTQDKDLQLIMGNLLRLGVVFSAVIVFIGGILYLLQTDGHSLHYAVFSGENKQLLSIGQIVKGVMHGHGASVIQLGLLLLMATPIARIVLSVIGFIREKDVLYTVITLLVLAIILISMLSG